MDWNSWLDEVFTSQVKCGRLYHWFLLVHNEINGGLMKNLLALQETACLVFLLEKAINLTTITISDKPTLHFSIWTSPILWNKKELVKRSPLRVVLLTSSSEWSPKMCYENNLLLNKNVYIITLILIEISFKFILLDIYFVKSFKLGIR